MSLLRSLVVLVLMGIFAGRVYAQIQRYQPAIPPTSPYLNLLRRNVGPLPNYHALVLPYLRQEAQYRETTRALQHNTRNVQRNTRRIGDLDDKQQSLRKARLTPPTGGEKRTRRRRATVRPTGTGSVFQSYSRYFPGGGRVQR